MSCRKLVSLIFTLIIVQFSLGFSIRVDDFRVNDSIPPSELEIPHVLTDFDGRFVVTWHDASVFEKREVYLKRYLINGSQIGRQIKAPDIIEQGQRINSANGMTALLPNGNIVVLRTMVKDSTDSLGNFLQYSRGYIDILDSLGNPLVSSFLVDTLPPASYPQKYYNAGLGADREGNFTVAFYNSTGGTGAYIFFQQFYPSGQKRGNLVNVACDSYPDCEFVTQNLALSMRPDGKFMLTWDASGSQFPFAGIYNSDGSTQRDGFLLSCDDTLTNFCVPSSPCLSASGPRAGMDSLGNFMAAFNVCTDDPTGKHVYARLFDSLGNPLTPNTDIQELEYTYRYFHRPRVVATENGEYVVIWVDRTNQVPDKPRGDIWAKRFNSAGQQVGIKYRINNKVGSVLSTENFSAVLCNEHLIVAWTDIRGRPSLYTSVYAQIMPVDEVGVFTPGDLNYDYNINLADLIGMVNYVFKGADPPEGSPLVCDVNGNCKVDIVDIIYLVNHLFKGGPSPVGCPI